MNKVTLWYVEFVPGSLGVWDRVWFLDQVLARTHYNLMVKEMGYCPINECGEQYSVLSPEPVTVELTPEGLLEFAETFAIDQGE